MSGYFQPFLRLTQSKKRGTDRPHRASLKSGWETGHSVSLRIVGTKPMCGLPVEPWEVDVFMNASEVVPQQDENPRDRAMSVRRLRSFFMVMDSMVGSKKAAAGCCGEGCDCQ